MEVDSFIENLEQVCKHEKHSVNHWEFVFQYLNGIYFALFNRDLILVGSKFIFQGTVDLFVVDDIQLSNGYDSNKVKYYILHFHAHCCDDHATCFNA